MIDVTTDYKQPKHEVKLFEASVYERLEVFRKPPSLSFLPSTFVTENILYRGVGEQRPEDRDTAVALFSGNGVHRERDRCSLRQPVVQSAPILVQLLA
jgi:hypothetical protein